MAGNSGSSLIMVSKLCADGVYKIGDSFKVLLASKLGIVGCAVAVLVVSVNATLRYNMNDCIDVVFIRELRVVLFLAATALFLPTILL